MKNLEKTPKQDDQQENSVSRRDILLGMGAAATFAYTGTSNAAMSEHDHSKHSPQNTEILDASIACVDKAQRCIAHCLVSFQEGDTELADCASKAHEMKEICSAFSYLLSANSSYIKEYARISDKVCQDCSEECRKHDKHHECKACADACDEIIDAIKLHLT